MLNQIERGKTPILPIKDLQTLGFNIVAYALTALMASVRAMETTLNKLKNQAEPSEYLQNIATFEDIDQLLNFPEWRLWESRFQNNIKL